MPTFKSLKDLEKFAQKKIEQAVKSEAVTSVFKHTMARNVETEVYDYYEPTLYTRREGDGGLSDENNMVFTAHTQEGKTLVSLFENLTVGSDEPLYGYATDSMNGNFISHLIENGSTNIHTSPSNSEDGWYETHRQDGSRGEWTHPRPFAKATAEELNTSGSMLNKVLKETLEYQINK